MELLHYKIICLSTVLIDNILSIEKIRLVLQSSLKAICEILTNQFYIFFALTPFLQFAINFAYLNSLSWSRAFKKCLICHNFLFSQTQFRKKTFKLLQIFVYYFSRAQGLSKKGTPNIFLGRRDVSSNILFNIVYCQFYFGLYRYPCRREHSLSVLITYFSTLLVGFLTIV